VTQLVDQVAALQTPEKFVLHLALVLPTCHHSYFQVVPATVMELVDRVAALQTSEKIVLHLAFVLPTCHRSCFQVVPATVMELVDRVVALQAGGLGPPAGRLPAAELKAHARLPARAEVAALTRRIAALAQGILAMERRGA